MTVHKTAHMEQIAGDGRGPYLTTMEAARYLRKSVSWLVRRRDIAYLRGRPNTYLRTDLDEWFENNKREYEK